MIGLRRLGCLYWKRQITAVLADELNAKQEQTLRVHLRECENCHAL